MVPAHLDPYATKVSGVFFLLYKSRDVFPYFFICLNIFIEKLTLKIVFTVSL